MAPFDYIIAMDFEATCWGDNTPIKTRVCEIIEFPAVLLNLKTGKVEAEFHEYIKPTERPILSDFCIKLTGISQATVDNGITLPSALKLFGNWLRKVLNERKLVLPYMSRENITGNVAFVAWTDYDFGAFLANECTRKNINKPPYFNRWVDLRAIYKSFFGRLAGNFHQALNSLGIVSPGEIHSGIVDARKLAELTYKLVLRGATLKITTDLNPYHKDFDYVL